MEEKFSRLPLRNGVGIIVLNKHNKVFVAKRIDNPKNFWQMPQGGVDIGEDLLSAAYRELEEETSIKNVKLIQEIEGTTTYELPKHLLGVIWKGKFKGQKQKWFLMRYLGNDNDIDIKTRNPEFLDWKWIDLKQITEVVVDFKLHVYKELQEKIKKIINWEILKLQFFVQLDTLIDRLYLAYYFLPQQFLTNLVFCFFLFALNQILSLLK